MSQSGSYEYYSEIFKGKTMPFAFVDLDRFDSNIEKSLKRSKDKLIRVASKSVRCKSLLEKLLAADKQIQGLMTFTVNEAHWLAQQGFDDLLMGYPCVHPQQLRMACETNKSGKTLVLMIDQEAHVEICNKVAKEINVELPVCLDLDMSSDFPGIHFGVWRSSITTPQRAADIAKRVLDASHLRLEGLMGYEAQIAGVGDQIPDKALINNVVKFLKKRSIPEIAKRRAEAVMMIQELGCELRIVNGGGTGSLESTTTEDVVTEVTVGSGFYSSGLFDNYSNFKHTPAAGYAIEVVRMPKDGTYTCLGGGYTASGTPEPDKAPKIWLPEGAETTANEGAGEVQTPVLYNGPIKLDIGSAVFMRHSKAGELCERFNSLYLVSNGKILDEVPTYRGEGKAFL